MDQLIVALDVDTADEALALARKLRGWVGAFKIGNRLFTSHGPAIVQDLVSQGDRVFLDLKYHDIPNTVAGAVAAATRLGVWMVNVHAGGGLDMMRAARQAADEEATKTMTGPPLVIAVTVLTSFTQAGLAATGVTDAVADQVRRLALLTQESGLDGVVASPQEIQLIREACDPRFQIVTPGIRGAEDVKGDQHRTASAAGALGAGANYLVVGRPIIAAADPRAAAERIAAECRA
jgi:orotidine-5'-phosphate decarboxylase